MKKYLIISLVVVLILLGAGLVYFNLKNISSVTIENSQPIACTKEAKICPDGSAVGRQGPKCEFEECPFTPDVVDEMTLSGIYNIYSGGMFDGKVCFYPDEASSKLIPSSDNDTRIAWFCFLDSEKAKKELNSGEIVPNCQITGAKATIIVSNYVLYRGESEGFDKANLKNILSSDKGKCLDKAS